MSKKLVQVNLSDETLHQIDNVKNRINAETKTGAIRSSIAIADMVTDFSHPLKMHFHSLRLSGYE